MHNIPTRLATLVRTHGLLALALLMSAFLITDAYAHTRVRVFGSAVTVRYFYSFDGAWGVANCANGETFSGSLPFVAPNKVYSPQIVGCTAPGADQAAWSAHSASVDASGLVSSYALVHGSMRAGGEPLGTLAFRTDTSFVTDSILFRVNRSGTTVTLNSFSGEIRAHRPSSRAYTRGRYTVVVYPSPAAAAADSISDNGSGAAFIGHLEFRSDGNVVPMRGFAGADFVVENNNGSNRVRPAAGLSKSFTVPDANQAVIVVTTDPVGDRTPRTADLPGASPFGLALLSLAMLAGGAWLLRRRPGSVPAA